MFGVYDNFPEMCHSVASLASATSTKKIQKVLIQSLHRLNRERGGPNFPEFARHNIKVELEIGVADGLTFNYLDEEILKFYREKPRKHVFPTLDFLCVVCYYVIEKEKRKPLRFDYHMLRFAFKEKEVELRVYHEKGTRLLPIGDLVEFLVEEVNRELESQKLNRLRIDYVRAF